MLYLIDVWHIAYSYSVPPKKHVIIGLCQQLTHFHTIQCAPVIHQRPIHPSRLRMPLQYQQTSKLERRADRRYITYINNILVVLFEAKNE